MDQVCTKISGLAIDTMYSFQLVLKTSGGTYHSNVLKVKTHKMTDLTGITITLGVLPQQLRDSLDAAVKRIGARIVDAVRIDTTHFVCTEGRGRDWERAVEMNIPVVRPEWIEGCEREGKIVGVRGYYLDANPKDRQIGSNPALGAGQQAHERKSSAAASHPSPPSKPATKAPDHPEPVSENTGPGPELPPTPPAQKDLPPAPASYEESEEENEGEDPEKSHAKNDDSPVSPASDDPEETSSREAEAEDKKETDAGEMEEVTL